MDPRLFLEFAKRMHSQRIIDEETDSRVGIDRSYFAAAHIIWNTFFEWTKDEMGIYRTVDLRRLEKLIHRVIRMTLEEVHSPCNNRIRDLFNLRNQASYSLSRRVDYGQLEDSIETADWIMRQKDGLTACLHTAYEQGLISQLYWCEIRERLVSESPEIP